MSDHLHLTRAGQAAARRWIGRPRRVTDPKLRLFCFPHVGSGAAVFNSWTTCLPAETELCAIRLPGRENRLDEPFCTDLTALLDGLVPALDPLLDQPFALFGHCSGSILAFELARWLRTAGRPQPVMLIASSIEAPAVRDSANPRHMLSAPQLFAEVSELGGLSREVLDDPELMALFEPTIRADFRMVEQLEYSAAPPLDVPITVIGGLDDKLVPFDALAAWRSETADRFSLHMLRGGHFVLDEAAVLVAGLMRGLAEELP